MFVNEQPMAVCKEHHVSEAELKHMIKFSAPYTHRWANRRWGQWIFDVDLESMEVVRMELAPAETT